MKDLKYHFGPFQIVQEVFPCCLLLSTSTDTKSRKCAIRILEIAASLQGPCEPGDGPVPALPRHSHGPKASYNLLKTFPCGRILFHPGLKDKAPLLHGLVTFSSASRQTETGQLPLSTKVITCAISGRQEANQKHWSTVIPPPHFSAALWNKGFVLSPESTGGRKPGSRTIGKESAGLWQTP